MIFSVIWHNLWHKIPILWLNLQFSSVFWLFAQFFFPFSLISSIFFMKLISSHLPRGWAVGQNIYPYWPPHLLWHLCSTLHLYMPKKELFSIKRLKNIWKIYWISHNVYDVICTTNPLQKTTNSLRWAWNNLQKWTICIPNTYQTAYQSLYMFLHHKGKWQNTTPILYPVVHIIIQPNNKQI